jgi:hypothetical protein
MTIAEVISALLATLPRCHACERPATRMMMSEHVPIPHGFFKLERGKRWESRPYIGPSMGAHTYVAKDGTWQWDCCDEHAMPEYMKPQGVWDVPLAAVIRRAAMVLESAARSIG